jgi:hypothetical protein
MLQEQNNCCNKQVGPNRRDEGALDNRWSHMLKTSRDFLQNLDGVVSFAVCATATIQPRREGEDDHDEGIPSDGNEEEGPGTAGIALAQIGERPSNRVQSKEPHNTKCRILGCIWQVLECVDDDLVRLLSRTGKGCKPISCRTLSLDSLEQAGCPKESRNLTRGDCYRGASHEARHCGSWDPFDDTTNAEEPDPKDNKAADERDGCGNGGSIPSTGVSVLHVRHDFPDLEGHDSHRSNRDIFRRGEKLKCNIRTDLVLVRVWLLTQYMNTPTNEEYSPY